MAVKNVSSLEDALWNMYVEEEVFDYDNLYHCGTCDKLVKAAKVKMGPAFSEGAHVELGAGRSVKWNHLYEVLEIHMKLLVLRIRKIYLIYTIIFYSKEFCFKLSTQQFSQLLSLPRKIYLYLSVF